jgi:hypothetical protein
MYNTAASGCSQRVALLRLNALWTGPNACEGRNFGENHLSAKEHAVQRNLFIAGALVVGLALGCGWESNDPLDDNVGDACDTVSVYMTSIPPNATVLVNNEVVGIADSSEIRVCVGQQQVRFVTDSCDTSMLIGFGTTNIPLTVEVCPPDTTP